MIAVCIEQNRRRLQMSSPKGLSAPARLHLEQQRQLLKEHPHLRAYSGPQPLQLVAVLALLAARWGLAYLLRDSPLVLIGVAASTLGVWLVHALGTYVHEQGHRLIVRSEPMATAVDVLIEVGITSFGTGVRASPCPGVARPV